MAEWTRDDVVSYIKQDLLLDRLGLASSGATLQAIGDDTPLMDGGFSVDSVDALDLLVGVERKFGLELPELSSDFIRRTCKDVRSLADYVMASAAACEGAPVS